MKNSGWWVSVTAKLVFLLLVLISIGWTIGWVPITNLDAFSGLTLVIGFVNLIILFIENIDLN